MVKNISISIRDDQKDYLDKNKQFSPSGIMQRAIDEIMKGNWELNFNKRV